MVENLLRRDISDEMKESYINYAMSVIISRALPDVRDGLKPSIAESCGACTKPGTPTRRDTASLPAR